MISEVGGAVGRGAAVVGGGVAGTLGAVVGKTVLKAGLAAVVNLAAVVGFSNGRVVSGFSVSTCILGGAGLSVWTGSTAMGWMLSLGGRVGSGSLTGSGLVSGLGSGLICGLEGLPLLGLNLLLELGASTMAWSAGGAGLAFSLMVSLGISFSILTEVLGMLLEFLTMLLLDLDLSMGLEGFFGRTSSP